jgi:hypothetical protein
MISFLLFIFLKKVLPCDLLDNKENIMRSKNDSAVILYAFPLVVGYRQMFYS